MGVHVKEKVKDSGVWWIFIFHKGQRKSKKIGNKATAQAVAREVEKRLAMGDLSMLTPECPTVSQYGLEWLKSPLREWSDGTMKEYESIFDVHIKPYFGSRTLSEIKRKHIKKFLGELNTGSARKRAILSVVSGILESALDDELIPANPCQKTQKFCGNSTRKKINPLTADEVRVMLENASKLPFVYYAFFSVGVRTGLRPGELLGLKWKDINFEKRHLTVRRLYYARTQTFSPGKNKKTRRVDLSPATVEVLRELQAQRKLVSFKRDDLVFTTTGEPLLYETVGAHFKAVAPRKVTLHSLRHSYATLRIAKGDNMLDVSKQLGHHSVSFTIDKYCDWKPGEHKAQVDELDGLFLSPYAHPQEA